MSRKNIVTYENLRCDIINSGICYACGGCQTACPVNAIEINNDGNPEPKLVGECIACGLCYEICPARYIPLTQIEKNLFGRAHKPEEHLLGIYKLFRAGYAMDPEIREAGAAGGIVTALLVYLLEKNLIDGAIVVGMREDKPWLATPKVVTTVKDIKDAAQSKYQMTANAAILKNAVIKNKLERIAFIGLPCHIYALRNMQLYANNPDISSVNKKYLLSLKNLTDKVKYTIGLLCGGNHHIEGIHRMLEGFCGIKDLNDIVELKYRDGEWPGGITVKTKDGYICDASFGGGMGDNRDYIRFLMVAYHRYACHLCSDYAAEVADISVGDIYAYKEPYSSIFIRTENGVKVIESAEIAGYIKTIPSNEDYVIRPDAKKGEKTQPHVGVERKKRAYKMRKEQRKKQGILFPIVE